MAKYPLSVVGRQCIGPCYYANTVASHPISLEEITANTNFCPTDKFLYKKDGKVLIGKIDECEFPTARKSSEDVDLNFIIPTITFDSEYFIKIYYKLNSLEETINWLDENKIIPFKTRERVFNNSMVVYGNELYILDNRLLNFLNEIMLYNIKTLYKSLQKYIQIENNMVNIIYPNENQERTKEQMKIIMAYIKEKLLGINNIQQFMLKFTRNNKNKMNQQNMSDVLITDMISHIIKKMEATVS